VLSELKAQPPLVFAGEARTLKASLARVAAGQAFLLQAGDCAESFNDVSAASIRERLKVLLQMAVILSYGATLPVVKVGRIAGQFSKPRSNGVETIDGAEMPSFFGHMVNGEEATSDARRLRPKRMLKGYYQSTATLNLLRAFTKGGFADLNRVHVWNQEFVSDTPEGHRYDRLADDIDRALKFMAACGVDVSTTSTLHEVDVYTSHEGLLLEYEEALTRKDSMTGDWYDCSAHMLWLGDRTRAAEGAHVEFFSGVGNPLGVKVGPEASPEEILATLARLDPDHELGRISLIVRLGAARVRELLPPIVQAVVESGHPVCWVSDPMHGNTTRDGSGRKTRHLEDVFQELEGFFVVCRQEGVWPGGVHLEFTADPVTECVGGTVPVLESDLSHRYETLCDPRLNARQSLDLAFRLAELLRV
jgi:3-deoxy-7-phosphoheptulonate synthase